MVMYTERRYRHYINHLLTYLLTYLQYFVSIAFQMAVLCSDGMHHCNCYVTSAASAVLWLQRNIYFGDYCGP